MSGNAHSGLPSLHMGDAVAAILVAADGRYVLQHRDDYDWIWYPGHWGCFGGGIEPGETPEAALRRELWEELGLQDPRCTRLPAIAFEAPRTADRLIYRHYYEVRLPSASIEDLALGEGRAIGVFDACSVFAGPRLVPYDAFALFLHAHADRISG